MPWNLIEWGLRLACLILEGVPVEARRATAMAWFWGTWPLLKLNPEIAKREAEILALVGEKNP